MLRVLRFAILLLMLSTGLAGLAAGGAGVAGKSPFVDVLTVKGVINPVSAGYVARGLSAARVEEASLVVIRLDTPGGLDTSMRDIVQSIVNSPVPVVVYVAPAGARAASAGVFITLAAHVAAMSPNTAIGAAHPVAVGADGAAALPPEMEEKVLNDAVAYIKSIAEGHGRNVDWAERAVRQSISATEQEALQLNVIDLVSPDLTTLLRDLDGRQVEMLGGGMVTLQTEGLVVRLLGMGFMERFLFAIADPNIAYILLSLAMLGLFFELASPGAIFPGVIGGVCLLLALFALGMLPVNIAGVLLIVLSFGLFLAEVFVTSGGLLAAGGVTALVVGSLILFSGRSPLFRVDPWLIGTVATLITGFFVFVVAAVVRGQRRRAVTGKEGLVGEVAVASTALNPTGMVFVQGERWTATAEDGPVQPGQEVVVTRVDGLKLLVKKTKEE